MRDMTVGKTTSHLWHYAVPLLLGNWMQLSYNAVDSMIAGRFIGKDALAAEGIAGPVMNLMILAISGMCIGAGILMSESFGAKDFKKLRKILANTLSVGSGGSVLGIILGILLAPAILNLLAVPTDIYQISVAYLRIIFLGLPFTFLYNDLASCLKSVGDSKTPLKFLAFSSILNAVLDLIFLGIFRMGIICSALTTVFAEAVSAVLAFWYMYQKYEELRLQKDAWKVESVIVKQIIKYGGPTALQQAIQPIGKVLIQGNVNALGVNAIAAFNAVTRVDDFACIPEQSISSSISTYIAQNRGAKKEERIRKGFRAGIKMEVLYWVFICSITLIFRKHFVGLFVTGDEASEVIRLGSEYLGYMVFFYFWPAMTNGVQGFFRGMGKMYTTMLGTFIQASIRTVCSFILVPIFGITGVAFSCVIGWTMMLLFEVPYYYIVCKKKNL